MTPLPERRYRLEIGQPAHVTIALVGCGGTGSFVALHLARLAHEARRGGGPQLGLVFVDPDQVEEKNIGRQNFCPAEVGLPKAIALASRYNLAFGLEIGAVCQTFAEAGIIKAWLERYSWREGLLLIVGCVDSPAARREIEQEIRGTGEGRIWWLDAGNDEYSGQILLGNGLAAVVDPLLGCTGLPLPSVQEPGIVEGAGGQRTGDGLSCAELMALNAQSLMINQAMAGWIGVYVYRLLLGHDLDIYQTWLDLRSGSARSVAITEGVEAEILPQFDPLGVIPVGLCPRCEGALAEGRDDDPTTGEIVDIVFCEVCGWRATVEAWEAQREAEARAALITGVRARRETEAT